MAAGQWQHDPEFGAAAAMAFGIHASAVGFDDRTANGQAQAHAATLCRKVGFKQSGLGFGFKSRPGIGHHDDGLLLPDGERLQANLDQLRQRMARIPGGNNLV